MCAGLLAHTQVYIVSLKSEHCLVNIYALQIIRDYGDRPS
jgi:hypothetical protein